MVEDSGQGSPEHVAEEMKTPLARQQDGYFDEAGSHVGSHGTGSPHTEPTRSQNSTSSLRSLSSWASGDNMRRALSAKSSHGQMRGRKHSKSNSSSSPMNSRQNPNDQHPVYPEQSFATLHMQTRPGPPLRTRSSHPAQNGLYNDVGIKSPLQQGAKTTDNTPMSSPGLFTSERPSSVPPSDDDLHHLQMPRETHKAEIEHDAYTGNKLINNYEIVTELGRGEHGKVKLGRNLETGAQVAIKIVPRYSRQRRLGRLGEPEDKTKKEVAILKKARHPHVVSLLEVIDDPNRKKVYLVLEFVDKGEITWRKRGVVEIIRIMLGRYEEEKLTGKFSVELADRERYEVEGARRRHYHLETQRALHQGQQQWSLEYGDEDEESDMSRSVSRQDGPSRQASGDDYSPDELSGTMYGSYTPEVRDRRFSMAWSGVSVGSEFEFDIDDERAYVPALTLEEARRATRDTLLGLEFLHYIGIIHRDIKPANLLSTKDGNVKISDFGVSYLGRPIQENDPEQGLTEKDVSGGVSAIDDEKELARSVGTPAFWAPEMCYEDPAQFEGGLPPKITGALDLWALGITLYCMVYARLPFDAHGEKGLHAAICTEEVFMPKMRLVPVDTTTETPTTYQSHMQINSNKRLDFELKFEVVPDHVRDLIRKLLTKDPVHRMTIMQAKQHPWVLEGVADPDDFAKTATIGEEKKSRILEPDEKEVSHAVVRRSIIERAIGGAVSAVGRLTGSLVGRSNTRKRAISNTSASSESLSPTGSASTVKKESRRPSLKPDEVLNALKSSREPTEHPLAQSESASPDREQQSYFDQSLLEEERRPRTADRMTTTDSLRTIKAPSQSRPTLDIADRVTTLGEMTGSMFGRLTSRTRGWGSGRSPSSSRTSSAGDVHAGASLALSTASAAGSIATPDQLVSPIASPVDLHSPRRELTSMPSDEAYERSRREFQQPITADEAYEEARRQSTFQQSILLDDAYDRARRESTFQQPISSDEAYSQARAINQRKLMQETQAKIEAESVERSGSTSDECPPSPDDLTYLEKFQAQSASTIASSVPSGMSQNMSNQSFGLISNASSPPDAGMWVKGDQQFENPEYMRTADTVKEAKPVQTVEDMVEDGDDEDSEDEGMMMGGK